MSKIHNAELLDSSGNRIVPRTLLQTISAVSQATVVLPFPSGPWNRFQVEIDNMASTQDAVGGRIRFVMNGSTRLGAADYAFHVASFPDIAILTSESSDALSYIKLTRHFASVEFGSQNNEAYSFGLTVDPGADAAHLPKIWGSGVGLSDFPLVNGISVYGMYRGVTSQEFGRAQGIEFSMEADTIRRGNFRLYGTE